MPATIPARFLRYVGGKGFPHEKNLADCPVKDIDIEQIHEMVLCCDDTAEYLYGACIPAGLGGETTVW